MTNYLPRSDTRQRASLRRRDGEEEFMMRNNMQRLGEHVTAALLGQVTAMSEEVAIVVGGAVHVVTRRRQPSPPVPSRTWLPARGLTLRRPGPTCGVNKAADVHLTRIWDIGPRTHGIRVNAMAPQLLDTPPTGPPSRPR
jgi:NAD(P)-dependent dehydrogenase (short-subunit alcohol dehydrogenase family)